MLGIVCCLHVHLFVCTLISERVRRDVLAVTIDNVPLENNTTEEKNEHDDGDGDDDDGEDQDEDDPYRKPSTTENSITGDSP